MGQIMKDLQIKVFSNYFSVHTRHYDSIKVIREFTSRFNHWGFARDPRTGRFRHQVLKEFFVYNKKQMVYRLHIHCFKEFMSHLKDHMYDESMYTVENVALKEPKVIDVKLNEGWVLRDYQEEAMEFTVSPNLYHSTLINLKTGRGKGVTSMAAIAKIGYRTAIVVKPMYIEKWKKELFQILNIDNKDVMIIKGGDNLKSVIQLAKEDKLEAKFIIFSNKTLQLWIKAYEEDSNAFKNLGYECTPSELFETLGVGIRLIDEVHQDFHFNFLLDLYTHTNHVISLSATLENRDAFMLKMYELAYPNDRRYREENVKKYIHSYAIMYRIKHGISIRTTEFGQKTYSHHAFEKSILKFNLLHSYFDMICNIAEAGYLKNYQKGDKLAIFASSIDMCTRLTDLLKKRYPHLDIRRYVQDDPYENVIDSDIRVTTILSAGTAIDIPQLTTTILTIAIDSIQANLQTLGRLRDIPGREVNFFYLVCEQVPKHVEYHKRREKLLNESAATFKELIYHKLLTP